MSWKWRVLLLLTTLAWWSLSPSAAAAKIEHFQDSQGTLHITNVPPEDQGKEPATPPTAPLVKPRLPQVPVPAVEPAPEVQSEASQTPPESPQTEAPPEPEVQSQEKPVSRSGGLPGGWPVDQVC